MTRDTVLANARVVLDDDVLAGSVLVRDGVIADISPSGSPRSSGSSGSSVGEDLDGDYLLPGVVELHTDHLEYHFSPRPGVLWDPLPAVLAHDAQLAAAGATTVLDAVRVGVQPEARESAATSARRLADAVESAVDAGLLRADHGLHLRCEVSAENCLDVFGEFADDRHVRLASLMDHTPGQRQFVNLDDFKRYHRGRYSLSEPELDTYLSVLRENSALYSDRNRKAIAAAADERGITLAAHDDATPEHVDESVALGVRISEFPTTVAAATAAVEHDLLVVMGAPNIVRRGSQSGNVAATDLLERGLLHVLSSDYVPASLLQAVFQLVVDGVTTLPEAAKLVSAHPARAVGLDDRGEVAVGKRADLVRVHTHDLPATEQHPRGQRVPVVRGVYRCGARVS